LSDIGSLSDTNSYNNTYYKFGGIIMSEICRNCSGSGRERCLNCDGAGGEWREIEGDMKWEECLFCQGDGVNNCINCDGTGKS
jgi:hypothetical protein